MKDSELREAIRWEAEEHLPYPVEDMAISYHVLQRDLVGSQGREMTVVLVGARIEAVDDLLQVFQQAGLSPAIIDVNSLALYNVFENSGITGGEGTALLNIGYATSNLLILTAEQPFLVRDIAFGGDNITRGLAETLSVTYVEAETVKRASSLKDAAERLGAQASEDSLRAATRDSLGDLIKEVVRSFEYFTSNKEGSPVTKIILSGGGSMVPGMHELLSEELEVPVEPLNPFANTSFSPDRVAGLIPELGPLFAIPVGCALREISSI
jgi:type IV pilus assembly protein PilM